MYLNLFLLLTAVSEVHSSMGKAVQMFCSGDWDPKRVPQGTECLEPLVAGAPSHLPPRPDRSFIGISTVSMRSHNHSGSEIFFFGLK